MTVVKVRLRAGTREIDVEGPRADVDALLERWWLPAGGDGTSEEFTNGEPARPSAGRPPKRPKKGRARKEANGGEGVASGSFDPQVLVNKMREDEDYELFEEKVLHAKNLLNKIKLVCWSSGAEHTTGEIAKVLHALGVKVGQPGVSNALNRARSEFLQDGVRKKGNIVRYKLGGKPAKDFESWLRA